MDWRTNGPALCAVFQTVSPDTITSAVAAPRGPKRSAAQMSDGEDDVRDVALGRKLGQQHQGGDERGALDQVPAREPAPAAGRPREDQRRDHERAREVRQPPRPPDLRELVLGDDVPQAQRRGAEARADERPHRGGRHEREDVAHPFQAGPTADQAAQEHGRDDHLERVADRLAEHRSQRRGEVRDQEVADDDAGPQPRPVEHEGGDPDPDRRPQRRHRAVQVRQPQADLRGCVVHRRQEADRDPQEHEPSGAAWSARTRVARRSGPDWG